MTIIERIVDRLTEMRTEGYRPVRLILGHVEAREVEAALSRPRKVIYGLLGEVVAVDEGHAPKLPYPLTERVEIFGVPVERVDQLSLLGVVGEGVCP